MYNEQIYPKLKQILKEPYFRYYKVNLGRPCPFWEEEKLCSMQGCAVKKKENIPSELVDADLGSVTFNTPINPLFKKTCEVTNKDFCVLDNPFDDSDDVMYVDLLENPERFTGYQGASAAKVWKSIYDENCFRYVPELMSQEFNSICLEKKVFYRLISGLHASISTHIAYEYYNSTTKTWGINKEIYDFRLKPFPERIENIYFAYMVAQRALEKLAPYLKNFNICTGDKENDEATQLELSTLINSMKSCPTSFNEKVLFQGPESLVLRQQFRDVFLNISRIMDCVGCEKCRLWGKLQITGLGTALKVLFSYQDTPFKIDYGLSRTEVVSLINGFGRLSESIHAIHVFKQMDEEENAKANVSAFDVACKYCSQYSSYLWVISVPALISLVVVVRSKSKKQKRA